MNKVKNVLKFAMRMEKDAGDFYSYYLDKVKSPETRKLFGELVDMEKQHYNHIKRKYDELGFEEPPAAMSWVVDNTSAAKDPHILADSSDITRNSEGELSDLSIIRMAYLIENDFAIFYENAAKAVETSEAAELLKELAGWEKQHKELFNERYQKLLKKHWADISSIIFS